MTPHIKCNNQEFPYIIYHAFPIMSNYSSSDCINGMYMSVRNIDAVSVPCEWSCICVSGISMLSLFLVSGHVYVCNIDIPDTYIHDHSQGTETTSIFLTHIYMTTHKEQRQHRYSWHTGISMLSLFLVSGHVYVCQEYRCCLCSLWVVMYMSVRNIDVVSVPCEWSCICRDNIYIPDRHIHDHSQGTETTLIFLTDIYMTTHKEKRQHRYSWQTYTWPLTRNRDNIDIPDRHTH
jgi:phosphatidylserine decarboxylase